MRINYYLYSLKNEKNRKYTLKLDFVNLYKKSSVNNLVYMDDEYGKKIESEMNKDMILLEINNVYNYPYIHLLNCS